MADGFILAIIELLLVMMMVGVILWLIVLLW